VLKIDLELANQRKLKGLTQGEVARRIGRFVLLDADKERSSEEGKRAAKCLKKWLALKGINRASGTLRTASLPLPAFALSAAYLPFPVLSRGGFARL
jgi:hypothetical protein